MANEKIDVKAEALRIDKRAREIASHVVRLVKSGDGLGVAPLCTARFQDIGGEFRGEFNTDPTFYELMVSEMRLALTAAIASAITCEREIVRDEAIRETVEKIRAVMQPLMDEAYEVGVREYQALDVASKRLCAAFTEPGNSPKSSFSSTIDQVATRFKPKPSSHPVNDALRAAAEAFGGDGDDAEEEKPARYARVAAMLEKWSEENSDFDSRVEPVIDKFLRECSGLTTGHQQTLADPGNLQGFLTSSPGALRKFVDAAVRLADAHMEYPASGHPDDMADTETILRLASQFKDPKP